MTTNDYLANFIFRDLLVDGPLYTIIPSYIETLLKQRYAKRTIHDYLCSVTHFGCWMNKNDVGLLSIDLAIIERFLQDQLAAPGSSAPFGFSINTDRAALRHLFTFLPHQALNNPVETELERYKDYLLNICGTSQQTCVNRCQHVKKFLLYQFGDKTPDLSHLAGDRVESFLIQLSQRWCPSSLRTFSGSIRSYFRFRTFQGDSVASLAAFLPKIPAWNHTRLPKVLNDAQIKAFLQAFDCADPVGMRDYAIARCLLDLGLRGHEVAFLTLDSIDWHNAILTLDNNKSKRVQQLPIPVTTGQAITHYLLDGRPQTSSRLLFARHRAPFDIPLTVPAIRSAMNRGFVRCNLRNQFCNTHVLRYTTATRLQKAGASIKEIADLLRHQSLDTASTYIRVDFENLRTVALAWPGSQL